MGHTRLGTIPTSKKWRDIIEVFANADDIAPSPQVISNVARLTLEAAEPALAKAADDFGLRHSFLVLVKLVLASRTQDWATSLADAGIKLPAEPVLFDLTASTQAAVDDAVYEADAATDIGEMAQRALGQAVTALAADTSATLFGPNWSDLQLAIRRLSTKNGFSDLGQRFFGYFLSRFLNSYLSRMTAGATGSSGAVRHIGDVTRFNAELENHCVQSARIVHDFCGEWYSKTNYQEGIDLENTSRFVAVALKKLASELKRQRAGS